MRGRVSFEPILAGGLVGHEAYVPTQQPEAIEDARLPRQDAHHGRSHGPQATPRKGAQAIGRLKGPSRARFEAIYSTGQRTNGELFRIHALPGTGLVGIATSREIGSHARRNRQKRRAAEALRGLDEGLLQGVDVAVTVKPAAGSKSLAEMQEELRFLVAEVRARWADGSGSD